MPEPPSDRTADRPGWIAVPGVASPPAFTDPEILVHRLVAAERSLREESTRSEALRRAAWVQQQAYRDLVVHPEWRDAVRVKVPTGLRDAFERNLEATIELRRLTEPRRQLPDWRIVQPPPAAELLDHYRAAEKRFGVGWEYLAAIHLTETRMGRIRGPSTAGARGPMQFLPTTWQAYGRGDINDPRDAILAAARYLVANGAPENMHGALYAYNHSDRYVTAITDHAAVMRDDPASWRGYYHWRVYYRLRPDGDPDADAGANRSQTDVILTQDYDAR